LGLTLEGVLRMSNYEIQLWSAHLWPDEEEAEPDTSFMQGLCDG
jgi:hypothetical protein